MSDVRLSPDSGAASAISPGVHSFDEYIRRVTAGAGEGERRTAIEAALAPLDQSPFHLPGHCAVCDRSTEFYVDFQYAFHLADGCVIPNWRERLECAHCGLNNRMRLALHVLHDQLQVAPDSSIYITEQITPMFTALSARYTNVTGSEFLADGTPPGSTNEKGVRFEDVTRLSFNDSSFDYILTFDVLEHVPDYRKGLRELARCLRPGGGLLMTVPFLPFSPTTVTRATVGEDGAITHLLEPEFHGDPLTDGVLCFYHFGWDLLRDMREIGFSDACLHFLWSREQGYLGGEQFVIVGRK